MNKKHYSDRQTRKKIGIFSVMTISLFVIFIFALIQNSQGAVDRFEALKAVDKAGGDVESSLNELRGYIYDHMNTEIGGPNGIYPPIQLSGTYERLVTLEEKRVNDINDNLIVEAKDYCEANGPAGFSGGNRIECINAYVDEKGTKQRLIDDSLYKYDFVAPMWSPDLAGFSLIAFIISACFLFFYIFSYFRFKHLVHMAN